MLQRDPSSRASLEEIENHPWLQGVNPSPTGHSAAPLTSHRSLSQEEHEIILQAMTSGNIADRDAIQQCGLPYIFLFSPYSLSLNPLPLYSTSDLKAFKAR